MPRYYIDTFDHIVCLDDEGHDLPDRDAAREMVHRTLAEMMRHEADPRAAAHFRADVRDESGTRIMTATLMMIIEETG